MTIPANPKIYHITHLRNLEQIARTGCIWSDAKRIELGLDCEVVGMTEIKRRRLQEINVICHPGTTVGQYVPFYFCARSVMLYILYRGNHPDLNYNEGQEPIIHLQADLHESIRWANENNVQWSFSDRNAGSFMAGFYKETKDLEYINWTAVASRVFTDAMIKDGKQAEFLMYDSFPWQLIEKIGVMNGPTAGQAIARLARAEHRPVIKTERLWYY